jgi:hypothetical protein
MARIGQTLQPTQQTDTPLPPPTYEALAAMLPPAEREVLEALGEIIALDLLRRQGREGAEGDGSETDSANFSKGRAC